MFSSLHKLFLLLNVTVHSPRDDLLEAATILLFFIGNNAWMSAANERSDGLTLNAQCSCKPHNSTIYMREIKTGLTKPLVRGKNTRCLYDGYRGGGGGVLP